MLTSTVASRGVLPFSKRCPQPCLDTASSALRPSVTGGRTGHTITEVTVLQWFLPSKPTGQEPVKKPSTGCGATQKRRNTNAWTTGREAHQNAGTNANVKLIYSLKQDDPGTHTHTPSGEAKRTRAQPTRTVTGGTGAQRATVLEQGPLVAPGTDQIPLFH